MLFYFFGGFDGIAVSLLCLFLLLDFFSGELMFFLLSRFLLFNWVLLIVFLFG